MMAKLMKLTIPNIIFKIFILKVKMIKKFQTNLKQKQHIPRNIAKPFCWRGSNFKINQMKKQVKRNKVERKNFIIKTLKFGDFPTDINDSQDSDPILKQLFQKNQFGQKNNQLKNQYNFNNMKKSLDRWFIIIIMVHGQNFMFQNNIIHKLIHLLLNIKQQIQRIIKMMNPIVMIKINLKNVLHQYNFVIQKTKIIENIITESIKNGKINAPKQRDFEKYGWFVKQQMRIIIRKIKSMRQHQKKLQLDLNQGL
ncbi:unnamed protein product [Paramecium sonneborni]|uniref:Uncharacterized protein n=1 Tax=Paramecium sonneborni TaxID=65129 RepID=A0A8S1QSB9_9CILI|nr:unnamed protein product [Paramecium sonneborni]